MKKTKIMVAIVGILMLASQFAPLAFLFAIQAQSEKPGQRVAQQEQMPQKGEQTREQLDLQLAQSKALVVELKHEIVELQRQLLNAQSQNLNCISRDIDDEKRAADAAVKEKQQKADQAAKTPPAQK